MAKISIIYIVCACLIGVHSSCPSDEKFPDNFNFGVASSAYQVEGGWNADGKGENIWDAASHSNSGYIPDGSTGDIACDSYHKYKEDVRILKKLGVKTYRFSLSWARILPTGLINNINQPGVEYYQNLINELKLAGIEPMVTLHHWDLPSGLKNFGGWLNPAIIDWFADYARLAFELYGEDVKVWSTFNEPFTMCVNHFYLISSNANLSGIGSYQCTHNTIKAHAKAYYIYNDEFRASQKGKISIVLNTEWMVPFSNSSLDVAAADRAFQFVFGWYAHPIFVGNYPQVMIDRVAETSLAQGFNRSRLPEFTPEEIQYIKGTYDYFGLNLYSASRVKHDTVAPNMGFDVIVSVDKDPSWPTSGADWLRVTPFAIRNTLKYIKENYNNPEVIVTENGYADLEGTQDDGRVNYHKEYLKEVLAASQVDGVKVTGYMAWCLMDNFEWRDGYKSAVTLNNRTIPKEFSIGSATSAYQIEGGWAADGKGRNIWDDITQLNPAAIADGSNGNIACDSYHKYKEDVQLLKKLNVSHYRFSLSWSRILPTGFISQKNEAGIQYYKNLIKELKENNIEPWITLYHWDLPSSLQSMGGWTSAALIDYFLDYADLAFKEFGEDVKMWFTFNEPYVICANLSPLLARNTGTSEYLCGHNLLLAHSKVYHRYNEIYRTQQNGKISIVLNVDWYEPKENTDEELEAIERKFQFHFGWFANPIFHGDYPEIMKSIIEQRSKEEKFIRSRLPVFTPEQIENIKGTHDFLGINHYTSYYVRKIDDRNVSYNGDSGVEIYQDETWETTGADWMKVTPWGLRKLMNWISDNYNQTEIIITENGYASNDTSVDSDRRLNYYQEYLSALLDAKFEDGVNVTGWTQWSLLDNFEWIHGYTNKYGIYYVDFNDENRTRTPKESVEFINKVTSTRCLVETCED